MLDENAVYDHLYSLVCGLWVASRPGYTLVLVSIKLRQTVHVTILVTSS